MITRIFLFVLGIVFVSLGISLILNLEPVIALGGILAKVGIPEHFALILPEMAFVVGIGCFYLVLNAIIPKFKKSK